LYIVSFAPRSNLNYFCFLSLIFFFLPCLFHRLLFLSLGRYALHSLLLLMLTPQLPFSLAFCLETLRNEYICRNRVIHEMNLMISVDVTTTVTGLLLLDMLSLL
jgi:hypothetical protein